MTDMHQHSINIPDDVWETAQGLLTFGEVTMDELITRLLRRHVRQLPGAGDNNFVIHTQDHPPSFLQVHVPTMRCPGCGLEMRPR